MSTVALIVSIVAAAVSCLMAWFTWQNVGVAKDSADAAKSSAQAAQETVNIEKERRTEEVNDRQLTEKAARSADVLVFRGAAEDASRLGIHQVIVKNNGPANAFKVTAVLDPAPIVEPIGDRNFPVIPHDYQESFSLNLINDPNRAFAVTVTWTDGNGPHTRTSDVHW